MELLRFAYGGERGAHPRRVRCRSTTVSLRVLKVQPPVSVVLEQRVADAIGRQKHQGVRGSRARSVCCARPTQPRSRSATPETCSTCSRFIVCKRHSWCS